MTKCLKGVIIKGIKTVKTLKTLNFLKNNVTHGDLNKFEKLPLSLEQN